MLTGGGALNDILKGIVGLIPEVPEIPSEISDIYLDLGKLYPEFQGSGAIQEIPEILARSIMEKVLIIGVGTSPYKRYYPRAYTSINAIGIAFDNILPGDIDALFGVIVQGTDTMDTASSASMVGLLFVDGKFYLTIIDF